MIFELIVLGLAFVVLIVASINDLKTREVPDYVSYMLLGIAIILRLLWFVAEGNANIILWAPISFSVLFLFSYLMYRAGQWGGGDVKVMMGLSVLLSWFPWGTLPFFVDFFLNSLIIGAFYGLISVCLIGILHWDKLRKQLLTVDYVLLPAIVIAVILVFRFVPLLFAILISLIIVAVGLFRYFRVIESNFLNKEIDVEQLTEGDWLLHDVKVGGKNVVKKRDVGLLTEDLKKLRQLKRQGKLKKVSIKVGIPFVPAFLISLIVTLAFGNVLLRIMSYGFSII
ncbi:MAG: A24 family peptidase [Candidatus Nanoarchaeia archaeon]|nr:A24 family peptidase [Candidatus Nanoarchaeia archaeon]MDD5239286.1 A24 family peptidase [Candidatus Nanoarchaeia archaeon]